MSASKIQALPNYVTLRDGRMYVDPKMLKVIPGYNVRDAFDPDLDDDDKALYRSMLGNGYDPDSPILCRLDKDGTLWIIRGHQRAAAAMLAKVPFVTIALETVARDQNALLIDLITSNNGKSLAETEKGRVYLALSESGMSPKDIAKHCGIGTAAWIKKSITLSQGNPELLALVRAGWTAPTNAILLTGAHGEEKTTRIVKRAAAKAKKAGRKKASNEDLSEAEQEETGTTAVTGRGRKPRTPAAPAVTPETPAAPAAGVTVTVLPEVQPEVPHTLPVIAGAPEGGPFKLGTGKANCDLFDVSGRSLGAFDDVVIAKQMLILINIGWQHIGPKASVLDDKPAPVPASQPAPAVPQLTKAQERAAAKARLKETQAAAEREAARTAAAAETVRKHAEAEAARKAAALEAEAARAAAAATAGKGKGRKGHPAIKAVTFEETAPLPDMIAAAALQQSPKGRSGRAMASAMVNATSPRKRA